MSYEDDGYYDRTPLEDVREATKKELRQELRTMRADAARTAEKLAEQNQKTFDQAGELRALRAEVEQMRQHWRPVPITHEWTPRDPQCALCDEPRDALRHQMPVVPDGG
jgi:SMC interacting uncharacterized protein involved in chromosome segregation